MKVVVLTSNSLRHKYITTKLSDSFDVKLIITEEKSPKIQETNSYSLEDATFVSKHFELRQKSEQSFFGKYIDFPKNIPHLHLPHKQINETLAFEVLKNINPDLIVLFGTSIIKKHIIEEFKDRIINLHLGLSPYFKGSATNLFPFFYNKLECIGSTIHLVTEKVDAGDILHQIRPLIHKQDTIHDIGNKVILQSGIELPTVLNKFLKHNIIPTKQNLSEGILCKIKDVTPTLLREIYTKVDDGLIIDYCKNKNGHINKTPIINNI